jgi:hypothetical protein
MGLELTEVGVSTRLFIKEMGHDEPVWQSLSYAAEVSMESFTCDLGIWARAKHTWRPNVIEEHETDPSHLAQYRY